MVWRCVQCMRRQHVDLVDAATLDGQHRFIWGQHDPCHSCGNQTRPIWWETLPLYSPPLRVLRAPRPLAILIVGDQTPRLFDPDAVDVYCGPEGTEPHQPTPEEMLRSVGL